MTIRTVTEARIDQLAALSALSKKQNMVPETFYDLTLCFARAEMAGEVDMARFFQVVQTYTFPASKWVTGDEEVKAKLKELEVEVPEGEIGPQQMVKIGTEVENALHREIRYERAIRDPEFAMILQRSILDANLPHKRAVVILFERWLDDRGSRRF